MANSKFYCELNQKAFLDHLERKGERHGLRKYRYLQIKKIHCYKTVNVHVTTVLLYGTQFAKKLYCH